MMALILSAVARQARRGGAPSRCTEMANKECIFGSSTRGSGLGVNESAIAILDEFWKLGHVWKPNRNHLRFR